MKKVLVLAHRGYRAKFPENSLLAFKKGFEFGADGLECDVQKTKDGKYVIIHDGTVDRTAKNGRTGEVGSMSFRQIRSVDLGSSQKIPELEEFLKAIPSGKFVNIELKDETLTPADCPELCAIILKYIERQRLLVSSFDHSLLPYFKTQKVDIGLLIGEEHAHLGVTGLIRRVIQMKPQSMNLPIQLFKKAGKIPAVAMIRIFRLFGAKIIFWTVNTEDEFRNVFAYGDGIITDQVEFIRARVDESESDHVMR